MSEINTSKKNSKKTSARQKILTIIGTALCILLLPILIRISKGSPSASGAAGNMDTMLVPIVKLQGQEIGLVAMVVGVLTSLSVPFIQPVLLAMVQ